ncbi:MAG: DUF3536 domain-containing protein, partial [Proteobacteria bacterium]|nr:DUF3536 domain-containing protein [Pseudomonadota bacterium]
MHPWQLPPDGGIHRDRNSRQHFRRKHNKRYLSSLFQDIGERSSIYAYSATREDYRSFQVGGSRLVIGRATVTSEITHISSSLCFGVLHLGDHSIACGTGEYQGAQKYEALAQEISAAFAGADFPKT